MRPELTFQFFGLVGQLRAYNLFALLGALTGAAVALPLLKREGLPARCALGLLAGMAAGFLVGARLLNFVINPAVYGGSLHLYTLRLAGLSLYGGIFGLLGVLLIWGRYRARRIAAAPIPTVVRPLLDALVLPGGLAFALARVGCFLNGCCAGKATHSRWGLEFPLPESAQVLFGGILARLAKNNATVNLYPTQLFELVLALIGLIPLQWLYFRRRLAPGTTFLLYSIWFSVLRLAVLPLRSLTYAPGVVHYFYPGLYLGLILIAVFCLIRLERKPEQGSPVKDT